ncbi:hypothetical protein DL98DRAFT_165434 [Cadophora sp. DSE1049]|nr:hypothetical protein DL98DRAFT_165434 [Cadophora sp. DSE1049]
MRLPTGNTSLRRQSSHTPRIISHSFSVSYQNILQQPVTHSLQIDYRCLISAISCAGIAGLGSMPNHGVWPHSWACHPDHKPMQFSVALTWASMQSSKPTVRKHSTAFPPPSCGLVLVYFLRCVHMSICPLFHQLSHFNATDPFWSLVTTGPSIPVIGRKRHACGETLTDP